MIHLLNCSSMPYKDEDWLTCCSFSPRSFSAFSFAAFRNSAKVSLVDTCIHKQLDFMKCEVKITSWIIKMLQDILIRRWKVSTFFGPVDCAVEPVLSPVRADQPFRAAFVCTFSFNSLLIIILYGEKKMKKRVKWCQSEPWSPPKVANLWH